MSIGCLLEAVRDRLRTFVNVDASQCDVTPGGRPIPSSGEYFIGIDDGGSENSTPHYLSETFSVDVYVSYRTGVIPQDRKGKVLYLRTFYGLNDICDLVKVALHGKYEVVTAANALVQESAILAVGFQSPLRFMGAGPARVETGDWSFGTQDDLAYLVKQLRFGGTLRVQKTINET